MGHIRRHATAIEARERLARKRKTEAAPKRKRGRPKKGEERPPRGRRRLERQGEMNLAAMLADLPRKSTFAHLHIWGQVLYFASPPDSGAGVIRHRLRRKPPACAR